MPGTVNHLVTWQHHARCGIGLLTVPFFLQIHPIRTLVLALCLPWYLWKKSERAELYFEGKGSVYTQEVLPSRLQSFPNFTQGATPSNPSRVVSTATLGPWILIDGVCSVQPQGHFQRPLPKPGMNSPCCGPASVPWGGKRPKRGEIEVTRWVEEWALIHSFPLKPHLITNSLSLL